MLSVSDAMDGIKTLKCSDLANIYTYMYICINVVIVLSWHFKNQSALISGAIDHYLCKIVCLYIRLDVTVQSTWPFGRSYR